ncbi:adenylate kinase [Oesophagostomum dentatum]|uniref:adenylate kinase n=1 Tax=Oesophagostomum dentatum TaxID=61180 RepID=A0A0B1T6C3_OESDE|nr:adenylate kinase [Oesophagostomum dentatum]
MNFEERRNKDSGRVDDNMESIKKRLRTYATSTAPVVDYYEKKNKLIKIKAHGTVEEIFAEVTKHLDKLIEKRTEGATVEKKAVDLTPLKKANLPIFFIAGGPGSGKGTQCAKLVEKYGLSHLSSGDLLREEVKSGSPRGAEITKIMKAGKLVPLETVLDLLKEAMLKEVSKGSKGFLIDGYPREVKQGEQFESEIQEANLVIFFDVSDDILTDRVMKRAKTSGRADDNMDSMKKRLKTFSTATAPVIDYYEKKKKLVKIKAHGSIEEIFSEIVKHMDPILNKKLVKSGSPRGAELTKIMKAGKLVPLEVVLDLLKEAMLKEVSKGSKGFLIDGYPREVKQGEQFESEIQESDLVIFFDVSDDVLTERVLKRAKTSGRADDNMESMKKRLKTFSTATAPVIDYYEKKKKLVKIKAHGTIEEIFTEVVKHMDPILCKKTTPAAVERKKIDLTPLKKANLPIFFIAGGPGSGKGTQCAKLVEKYGLSHLSSGDLLREEIKAHGTIEEIFAEVVKHLDSILNKKSTPTVERKTIDLTPLKTAKVPIFFIVGGPGAGKGTQCEKMVAKFGLSHLSSGDLLRDEVKSGSPRGEQLNKIMQAGELVPLKATAPVIEYYEKKKKLIKNKNAREALYILDGFKAKCPFELHKEKECTAQTVQI